MGWRAWIVPLCSGVSSVATALDEFLAAFKREEAERGSYWTSVCGIAYYERGYCLPLSTDCSQSFCHWKHRDRIQLLDEVPHTDDGEIIGAKYFDDGETIKALMPRIRRICREFRRQVGPEDQDQPGDESNEQTVPRALKRSAEVPLLG